MFTCKIQGSSLPPALVPPGLLRLDVIDRVVRLWMERSHDASWGSRFLCCFALFRNSRERAIEGSIFIAQR